MKWPTDVDGDVFRRMDSSGFDFAKEHEIDFSVDFDRWPPPAEAMTALKSRYPNARVVDQAIDPATRERYGGYLAFKIRALVTYELVMKTQADVTQAMLPFGGRCEAWGVMQL
jgi:hypothetical protein